MAKAPVAWRPVYIKQETILDRRMWVYYLIIIDRYAKQFGKLLEARPNELFYDTLSKHVEAYLKNGTPPPHQIEGAVLNAADDYLAGRDVTLRAGDCIAVQNFIRG